MSTFRLAKVIGRAKERQKTQREIKEELETAISIHKGKKRSKGLYERLYSKDTKSFSAYKQSTASFIESQSLSRSRSKPTRLEEGTDKGEIVEKCSKPRRERSDAPKQPRRSLRPEAKPKSKPAPSGPIVRNKTTTRGSKTRLEFSPASEERRNTGRATGFNEYRSLLANFRTGRSETGSNSMDLNLLSASSAENASLSGPLATKTVVPATTSQQESRLTSMPTRTQDENIAPAITSLRDELEARAKTLDSGWDDLQQPQLGLIDRVLMEHVSRQRKDRLGQQNKAKASQETQKRRGRLAVPEETTDSMRSARGRKGKESARLSSEAGRCTTGEAEKTPVVEMSRRKDRAAEEMQDQSQCQKRADTMWERMKSEGETKEISEADMEEKRLLGELEGLEQKQVGRGNVNKPKAKKKRTGEAYQKFLFPYRQDS